MEIVLGILQGIGALTVFGVCYLVGICVDYSIKERIAKKQERKRQRNQKCPYGVTIKYWFDEIEKLKEKN